MMTRPFRLLLLIPAILVAGCGFEPTAELVDPHAVPTVFLGDSITHGWNLAEYFPRAPYTNAGVDGQTTALMLARFDASVVELRPAMVVILAGTNDILDHLSEDQAIANLTSMVARARAAGIEPVVATIPPLATGMARYDSRDFRAAVRAYNARVRTLGAPVVDYYAVLAAPDGEPLDGVLYDGVHPTSIGYIGMTKALRAVIP